MGLATLPLLSFGRVFSVFLHYYEPSQLTLLLHGMSHDCCRGAALTQTLDEVFFTSRKSLHHAIHRNALQETRQILEMTPYLLHQIDSAGYAPLLYAKSPEMIEFLLNSGANPSAVTREGRKSVLHRRAECGDVSSVRALLTHGVLDVLRDYEGHSAKDLAQQNGHDDVVRLLCHDNVS